MKNLLFISAKSLMLILVLSIAPFFMHCNDDGNDSFEFCGKTVEIVKTVQESTNTVYAKKITQTMYSLELGELNKSDLIIEVSFAKKPTAPSSTTNIEYTIESSNIHGSKSFLAFINYEEPVETEVQTESNGGLYTPHVKSAYHESPKFTITFKGECPEETTTVEDEDIAVVDKFNPSSFLINQEILAGMPISVQLISNNQGDSEKTVTITSSLEETEVIQLTDDGGIAISTLETKLSNVKGTDNDGELNGQNGTIVTFTYEDNLDEDGNKSPISVELTLTGDLAPTPTCDDGIQNGEETAIDCGGSDCAACATCDDGIMNGAETDIDCGGPDCDACPTCDDGIMNGGETDVDCGGPDCDACPTCDDGVMNGDETDVDCGGSCDACAIPGCMDSGSHNYNPDATVDDGSCETCIDGSMNGDETGVDCGGSSCDVCTGVITFNGQEYTLDDLNSAITSYDFEGINYSVFDMGSTDGGGNTDLFISLEFYSDTAIDDATYNVDGNPDGITSVTSTVSTENGANLYAVTGGSVTLSDNGTSLVLNLTTGGGNLTGSYTYPP